VTNLLFKGKPFEVNCTHLLPPRQISICFFCRLQKILSAGFVTVQCIFLMTTLRFGVSTNTVLLGLHHFWGWVIWVSKSDVERPETLNDPGKHRWWRVNLHHKMMHVRSHILHFFGVLLCLSTSESFSGCPSVHTSSSSRSCGHISVTPWQNFFKFGTNVHLYSKTNWLDFGG